MKKSTPIIIILLAMLVLLSGCVQKAQKEKEPSFGSTDAIAVSFMSGTPPTKVLEGDSFDIELKIENKGEYTVKSDEFMLYLLGINPVSFGKAQSNFILGLSDNLRGTKKVGDGRMPGGIEYLSVSDLTYDISIEADQKFNLLAQACYYYQTRAESDICISPNAVAQTLGTETCKVNEKKSVRNSVGPVKIIELTEAPLGRTKYAFTFKIKNEGDGLVFTPTTDLSKCTTLSETELNKIKVENITVGGKEVCGKRRKVYPLSDEGAEVFCTFSSDEIGEAAGSYEEKVQIILRYGYITTTKKSFTIQNIPEFE